MNIFSHLLKSFLELVGLSRWCIEFQNISILDEFLSFLLLMGWVESKRGELNKHKDKVNSKYKLNHTPIVVRDMPRNFEFRL